MEIKISAFEVDSKNGSPAVYTSYSHSKTSSTLLVSFPGMAYSMDAPLMWYSTLAAIESGYDVLGLEYSFQVRGNPGFNSDLDKVVGEITDGLKKFLKEHKYEQVIFLAKSIGTVIGPRVMEEMDITLDGFVFLTPLERTLNYINSSQKMLAVIGEIDPAFPPHAVKQIRDPKSVMLVPGADHGMEIPGKSVESVEVLKNVTARCKQFFLEIKK